MSCISPTSRQPLFVVVFLSRASTGNRETPASPATDDVIFIIPQALFSRLRWFPNIRSGAVPSEVRKTVKLSASTHSASSFRFNCLRPQLSLNTTSHQQKKTNGLKGDPLPYSRLPLRFQVFTNRVPGQRKARNGHHRVTVNTVQRFTMDCACPPSRTAFQLKLSLGLDRFRVGLRSDCESL